MLKVENIDVYYGAIHAVKNVSFEVGDGEIVALIGANGAGKSTILKTVSGLMHPARALLPSVTRTSPIQRPISSCAQAWPMCRKAVESFCKCPFRRTWKWALTSIRPLTPRTWKWFSTISPG